MSKTGIMRGKRPVVVLSWGASGLVCLGSLGFGILITIDTDRQIDT